MVSKAAWSCWLCWSFEIAFKKHRIHNLCIICIITKPNQSKGSAWNAAPMSTFAIAVKWWPGDSRFQACCSCRETSQYIFLYIYITTIWDKWKSPERMHATQVLLKCAWSAIALFRHLITWSLLAFLKCSVKPAENDKGWHKMWQSTTQQMNVTMICLIALSLSLYMHIHTYIYIYTFTLYEYICDMCNLDQNLKNKTQKCT